MSMTMVAPVMTGWAPTIGEQVGSAAIVATRATTFMRAQAQWLRRGLEHADDTVALAVVLAAHDRSHDRWVGQIAAVEASLGARAAQSVNSTYIHLGRLAGSLEAGGLQLLPAKVCEQACHVLADRLTDITESAVEALWEAAAAVSQG